jgi:hypothetical protein
VWLGSQDASSRVPEDRDPSIAIEAASMQSLEVYLLIVPIALVALVVASGWR